LSTAYNSFIIHSFYFTENKLHKNIMNVYILSVLLDRKASGTNNCPYRHKHKHKTQSKKKTNQMSKANNELIV